MSDRKTREQTTTTTELDEGELDQVQGGGLRAARADGRIVRKRTVAASKIRTGSKKLDFDGTGTLP